jgi:glucuronoarabinoxylan endo-1,4-beta-xylanase
MPATKKRPTYTALAATALALAATATLALAATATPAAASRSASPAAASATATINGSAAYQRISGFGASEAFGQAQTVMNAPAATQQQVLSLLYGRSGAALTMLRNEIPSDSAGTIEPVAPASPSAPPAYRALGNDEGQEWFARTIQRQYGVHQFFADAWGAPAFMKTNNSDINGGTLCGVPGATCASGDWRQAYANYLVQYAKDYQADGIRLGDLGFENEANLAPGYSGMVLSPAQTANFAGVVGPALARSGLATQLECCAAEGWDYAAQYASAIENDPVANRYVRLFTSHGYTAPPASPLPGWTKPVWQTEWSTFQKWDPAWDDGTTASGLTWAQNIYTGLTRANLSAFLYWWGSTTPAENGDNEGLIQIDGSTVETSGRLWAFANYSRFVRPGAVRIGAASPDSAVDLIAFRNTDGSVAVVALNTSASAVPMAFSLRGRAMPGQALATPYLTDSAHGTAAQAPAMVRDGRFAGTLPARSLVTYVIRSGR